MTTSSLPSGIWSSLFTLESTAQYVSFSPEPYDPLPRPRMDEKHLLLNKRHQTLASAVAIICASSHESKTVTACSTEISLPSENRVHATVILRVAQNQVVPREELQQLQHLVDVVVQEVLQRDKAVRAFQGDRQEAIEDIAEHVLLPLVVRRCRTKISGILNEPYSTPFRDWYANTGASTIPETVNANIRESIEDMLIVIHGCSGIQPGKRTDDLVKTAVMSAHGLIEHDIHLIFESEWAAHSSEQRHDEEYMRDRDSMDLEGLHKNGVERFLRKLGRYYTACRIVVRELVALHCSGNALSVSVETVPFLHTVCTPAAQHDYEDLESFLRQRIRIDVEECDPKKIGGLRSRWAYAWETANLFLHPEMQLVLFYALNPQLFPVHGRIGVSEKCCWSCDFVLKRLQSSPDPTFPDPELDRYTEDATGTPMFFSVGGSHAHNSLWAFPDPSKYAQLHKLDHLYFTKVCRRFSLVHEDLENALVKQVKLVIPNLLSGGARFQRTGKAIGQEGEDLEKEESWVP